MTSGAKWRQLKIDGRCGSAMVSQTYPAASEFLQHLPKRQPGVQCRLPGSPKRKLSTGLDSAKGSFLGLYFRWAQSSRRRHSQHARGCFLCS